MTRDNTLYTKTISPKEISIDIVIQMHELFKGYYENASYENFINDLEEKDSVIIVFEKYRKKVVGFTTIKSFETKFNGKKIRAVFSGDTILYKEYWGSKAMHTAFLKYVVTQKFKNPTVPLYWFLISKGYKTYLMMANNFLNYYPKLNGENKNQNYLKGLTKHLCDLSYPGFYDEKSGVLNFGESYQALKEEVAEITEELKRSYPKINFFEEMNPGWRQGHELACVGEMSFELFSHYSFKLSKSIFINNLTKLRKKLRPAIGI